MQENSLVFNAVLICLNKESINHDSLEYILDNFCGQVVYDLNKANIDANTIVYVCGDVESLQYKVPLFKELNIIKELSWSWTNKIATIGNKIKKLKDSKADKSVIAPLIPCLQLYKSNARAVKSNSLPLPSGYIPQHLLYKYQDIDIDTSCNAYDMNEPFLTASIPEGKEYNIVTIGQVPINIHNVGLYFREFFMKKIILI